MVALRQNIIATLPSLRRYACALIGDRRMGDEYIRVALMVLADDPRHVRANGDIRFQLFKLLHRVLDALIVPVADPPLDVLDLDAHLGVKQELMALPLLSRKLLLLVTVERFALERAAQLLGLPLREARSRLARARMQTSCVGETFRSRPPERLFEQRAA